MTVGSRRVAPNVSLGGAAGACLLALLACAVAPTALRAAPGAPAAASSYESLNESNKSTAADALDVALGLALFERLWVPAPASTKAADGLGPLYNARSCAGCHPGGGPAPLGAGANGVPGVALRLAGGDGAPHPRYGAQLQERAAHGVPAEGRALVRWRPAGEGRPPRPDVMVVDLGYGPLDAAVAGLRRAPDLAGSGLLERVPEAVIRAGAGLNGGAPGHSRDGRLGRFGWRAETADLAEQTAAALSTDIGVSSPLRPDPYGDCTPEQTACRAAPLGEGLELGADGVRAVVAYLRSLPPPAPKIPAERADPGGVGRAAFDRIGCAACHRPDLFDAARAVDPDFPAAPAPYTDLLTHDLGPDLSDRPLGEAGAAAAAAPASMRFRTAPLWGLSRRLNGPLLHDGRAKSLASAIAAHEGEAAAARRRFSTSSPSQRRALLRFLSSL